MTIALSLLGAHFGPCDAREQANYARIVQEVKMLWQKKSLIKINVQVSVPTCAKVLRFLSVSIERKILHNLMSAAL